MQKLKSRRDESEKVPVFDRDVIEALSLSFSTKKKPAPARDEEGRMMPAAGESLMYFSIALVSAADREKSL